MDGRGDRQEAEFNVTNIFIVYDMIYRHALSRIDIPSKYMILAPPCLSV